MEALCQQDTNLASADAAIHFAVVRLEKQRPEIAKTLSVALRARIQQRRSDLSSVLLYLNNPKVTSNDETFTIPRSGTILEDFPQFATTSGQFAFRNDRQHHFGH